MNDQKTKLLNAARLPARLNDEETAAILGFQKHDIPLLIQARILTPLGKPAHNATKYFAACDIEEIAKDRERLVKATEVLYRHWRKKNRKTSPEMVNTSGLLNTELN